MSRGRQALIGCGLGCLALALLGIASCVSFMVWINRPGDVLEPEKLLGAESTGYVEWTLRLEDPGTREFFELMLAELQELNESAPSLLPPAIDGPLRRMQQKSNEKKLRRMFPVVLAFAVEPHGPDTDDHVASASLRGLDHQLLLADWIMGMVIGRVDEAEIVRHRDEKIYLLQIDEEKDVLPLFIHHGDLFFTSDENQARRAIDRLKEPSLLQPGPALQTWIEKVPGGSLRGALSNRRGEVWRIWSRFLDPEIGERIDGQIRQSLAGLTVRGEFTPDGAFEAMLDFHFEGSDEASSAEDVLRLSIEDLLAEGPVEVAGSRVLGNSVQVDLEVADIPDRIQGSTWRID